MKPESPEFYNALINESSPYLLQHAHNPVNWFPWNDDVLNKARIENKLLLISIGYAACHWCHVMAHESFEDQQTADIMNKYYINIKVDREERPDVDQVYMHAVQLMTGRGGWPLNCLALPDGRPFYGGTYFQKSQWQQILLQVADLYLKDKNKCIAYAGEIGNEINKKEKLFSFNHKDPLTKFMLDEAYNNWRKNFDMKEGGPDRFPKFPLPNNYEFLLKYYYHTGNSECLNYIKLSLDKMAMGGIYDHIGGGFARYATDAIWKVPHFEKMLYDNAQLISLYVQAWKVTKNELYKEVIEGCLDFVSREMTHPDGSFYSSIDADSEGVEGKYYVWTKKEIENLLGKNAGIFADYFNMNQFGDWEHGNYILLRKEADQEFAGRYNLSGSDLKLIITECKKKVFNQREIRIRPAVDTKILVSWNALMLKAYVDVYKAFSEIKYLNAAIKNAFFLMHKCTSENGGILHTFNTGKLFINGFLEDYCFVMEALIALYEVTADEKYLLFVNNMAKYCFDYFYDQETGLFYFTSSVDSPLIARKMETEDNVIPSSNSSMAKVLFFLGLYFPENGYKDIAKKMVLKLTEKIIRYPSSYSNWALLLSDFVYPFFEIAIAGSYAKTLSIRINLEYLPNILLAPALEETDFPLLQNRFVSDKTLIYVCENQSCQQPVTEFEKCLSLIRTG